MRAHPLLVLAYNRPDKMVTLISALRELAPPTVLIAVDGPKPGNESDRLKVAAVQDAVALIDWTDDVSTRFRPTNLGLRVAVADAVSWAVSEYGQVTVIEDDAVPGKHFLPYSNAMLERFRNDSSVAHVSGYNLVPRPPLSSTSGSRLTWYPESFAWSTWEDSWSHYDPSMEWARNVSLGELETIVGSPEGALRWKQHFSDAQNNRISTWAYRWIASMWSMRAMTVSPNQNLVTYNGYDVGTHTTLTAPWSELPLFDGEVESLYAGAVTVDETADRWVGRTVFGESARGVAKGFAISRALDGRNLLRRIRK